jgi:ATP-dependent Clp protease adaptor protein ClpS
MGSGNGMAGCDRVVPGMTPYLADPALENEASMGSTEGVDSGDDSGKEADVAVLEGLPKIAEPPRYAVVLHNDDYTTMECVVEILRKFFHLSADQAHLIMLRVHREGKGIAGIYSYEIAETKASQAMEFAKSRGYPLKCTVEPHSNKR